MINDDGIKKKKISRMAGWQDGQERKKEWVLLLLSFLTILPSC
jgi:hypothetical protein